MIHGSQAAAGSCFLVLGSFLQVHFYLIEVKVLGNSIFSCSRICCSVTQSCRTPCDPMDCSTAGFPVLHYLLEFAQTEVQWNIQLSHPLMPPSPPAFSLSQHQDLFQWVGSSYQVGKVLELQLQYSEYSGLISFRIDWLHLLAVQGTLRVFSTVQKHHFFCAQLSL